MIGYIARRRCHLRVNEAEVLNRYRFAHEIRKQKSKRLDQSSDGEMYKHFDLMLAKYRDHA